MNRLAPLSSVPSSAFAGLRAVLTDIDDTLTTEGRVTGDAYVALERLRAAGLLVIPITGRPAGWCDMIARTWPVDAVVGENGAFYFRYDEDARRMIRVYSDPSSRSENRRRLDALAARILSAVPGAAISADQPYREADLAIDFREDVPPLPDAEITRIAALFEEAGATAKISSIHVNGWFGTYDKLTMTRRCLAAEFGIDIDTSPGTVAFAGDSPNDAPMFGYFPLSFGVANVLEQRDHCAHLPAYVTPSPRGRGFTELAEAILAARS